MHRKDPNVDIVDTMRELKQLVQEGKVRHIGLSEVTPHDLRRAHAVHPIAAVQLEWSLWTRDAEVGSVGWLEERGGRGAGERGKSPQGLACVGDKPDERGAGSRIGTGGGRPEGGGPRRLASANLTLQTQDSMWTSWPLFPCRRKT